MTYVGKYRSKQIYDLRLAGRTYDSLAEEFGICREAVRSAVFRVERIIDKACARHFEPVHDMEAYGVWHTFTHEGRQVHPMVKVRKHSKGKTPAYGCAKP